MGERAMSENEVNPSSTAFHRPKVKRAIDGGVRCEFGVTQCYVLLPFGRKIIKVLLVNGDWRAVMRVTLMTK